MKLDSCHLYKYGNLWRYSHFLVIPDPFVTPHSCYYSPNKTIIDSSNWIEVELFLGSAMNAPWEAQSHFFISLLYHESVANLWTVL